MILPNHNAFIKNLLLLCSVVLVIRCPYDASLDLVEQTAYMPFDPIVKRTEGTLRETATGKVFKTTKGGKHKPS